VKKKKKKKKNEGRRKQEAGSCRPWLPTDEWFAET
jgi:hypothetical protein